VHARYGGRIQGGISPSSQQDVVMFFTHADSDAGAERVDGWGEDGLFHYVGEGSVGDQQMAQGNKTIFNHRRDGRSLEGFLVNGADVTYLGEFEFVGYYTVDGPDTENPVLRRQMIVFRLRSLNDVPVELRKVPFTPATATRLDVVEPPMRIEVQLPRKHVQRAVSRLGLEAELVKSYAQHLQRTGHETRRLIITPPDEGQPMVTDLFDETRRELVEAKSRVTRDQIRMAIATLIDFGRFVPDASQALLVPARPRPDLIRLLHHADVTLIYPDGANWIRESPDASERRGSGADGTGPRPTELDQ
jgi:hypothetical protein